MDKTDYRIELASEHGKEWMRVGEFTATSEHGAVRAFLTVYISGKELPADTAAKLLEVMTARCRAVAKTVEVNDPS
jgi:hypothetical protein